MIVLLLLHSLRLALDKLHLACDSLVLLNLTYSLSLKASLINDSELRNSFCCLSG